MSKELTSFFIVGRIGSINCVEACIVYLQKRFGREYRFYPEYDQKETLHLIKVKPSSKESNFDLSTEVFGGMIEAVFAFNEGYKQGYEAAADYHAQESAGDNL